MRRRSFALLLGVLFWIQTALASEPKEDAPSPWEFSGPSGKISQTLSLFAQPIAGLPLAQERIDAELEMDLTNGEFAFRLAPWIRARIPEGIGGLPAQARAWPELKEAWAERTSESWDIRVGNQILAWGAADQINPTDVWNPRDLTDPFQGVKLPVTVAKLKVHPSSLESFSLEMIFTPFFRESAIPLGTPESGLMSLSLDESRWLLPVPSSVSSGGLSAPLTYAIAEASYPATWALGGRLSVLRLGGWDFSVSGFSGVEHLPRYAVTKKGSTTDPDFPITLTLNPSFHREEMFGLDGSGSVTVGESEIGTRFEAAYFWRDNSRVADAPAEFQADLMRDDYVHAVLGMDYTFQRNILGTVLYVNLQYIHQQRVGSKEQSPGATVIEGLPVTDVWDRNLMLYWENRVGSKFKFSNSVLASLSDGDGFVSPAFHYAWTDTFKSSVGADAFVGSAAGFFGQFADNTRFKISAEYLF